MSILVSVQSISKTYGSRTLFEDLSFSVQSEDRIGLIGPNGAGKTTLLKILSSEVSPDSGSLSFQRGLRVGFLRQTPEFEEDATIESTIHEGSLSWEESSFASQIMSRLGLSELGKDLPVDELSGGWKKRVALARELAKKPDLLLLDEPTNHLDVESILWLEEFLANTPIATITITHDRLFLQRVSNRIIELDRRHAGGLLSVSGDYVSFLEARDLLISAQERREVILKNTLRRETEWLRQGAKARTTKQQARIQRAGDLKDEVEDLNLRNQVRTARIDFQSTEKSPKKLVQAVGISKNYDGRVVFPKMDLLLTAGSRIGLLGRNGCGKSTLIRVLLGLEKPTTGTVTHAEQLSVAYFDQVREALDPDLTVAETICPRGDHVDYRGRRLHIKAYLDRFLFQKEQFDFPVGKLSGGEQSRLMIARLMLTEANLLVLDEPTNDLDMATLGVLEECLKEFSGAVLLVTHDRYFLDQVANQILAFPEDGGELVAFTGLAQWESWHAQKSKSKGRSRESTAQPSLSGESSVKKTKSRLSYKDQRELDSMESTIHQAEEKLQALTRESENPELATNALKLAGITKEMAALESEIARLYARWAELSGE